HIGVEPRNARAQRLTSGRRAVSLASRQAGAATRRPAAVLVCAARKRITSSALKPRAGRGRRMDAWDRLRWLFDTDDGGLYDIRLTGLDEAGLVAAFEFVRSRSVITP